MLHIPIRLFIAIAVSATALFLPNISEARKSLAEMAAGLTIDETLELEKQQTNPEEKIIKLEMPEIPEKPKSPLLQPRKRTPNTAAPAQRLPLYMYRSFGNNYKEPAPKTPEPPTTKPETRETPRPPFNTNQPSPAEQAVTKDFNDIQDLEPATGKAEENTSTTNVTPTAPNPAPATAPPADPKTTTPAASGNTPPSDNSKEAPTATQMDEKEKSMRETIERVEEIHGKKSNTSNKPEQPDTPPAAITNKPSQVTRIGSVPTMEKEVDYVSVLEKSLLLDPQPLPLKLAFYDENGNEVTLKQFKGKLILLNFWATWCTPCAMEMPSLNALQEEFNDKELPVKVIALSEDFKGIEAIREFYKQNHIEFLDIYHDRKNTFFRELGVISLPTTMLIDQKGNEILRMSGYIDWNKPEVQDFIRSFLSE